MWLYIGCCWAFSAVAAVEGITKIKTGELISLSEQEVLDCDTSGNRGCNGGIMNNAFQYIQQNQGLSTEADYPYQGEQGTCNSNNAASKGGAITGYDNVPSCSEAALLNAVANQPVSVGIEGDGFAFRSYSSGVFTGYCGTTINHAVTVVGYGTSDDGTKYWLLKNSWGTDWGDNGYIRIQRDVDAPEGLCGITKMASYPNMA